MLLVKCWAHEGICLGRVRLGGTALLAIRRWPIGQYLMVRGCLWDPVGCTISNGDNVVNVPWSIFFFLRYPAVLEVQGGIGIRDLMDS